MVLAAAQSPLLGDKAQAAQLIPRLCSIILNAPTNCRHVRPIECLLCPLHASTDDSGAWLCNEAECSTQFGEVAQ